MFSASSCEMKVSLSLQLGPRVVSPAGTEDVFEDFEAYSVGQVLPSGGWSAFGGLPTVEEGIQADGLIGKYLRVDSGEGIRRIGHWRDFILEMNVKRSAPWSVLKVYFRLSDDAEKGYYLVGGAQDVGFSLYKFNRGEGKDVLLGRKDLFDPGGDWFYLGIEVSGGEIKVRVNDEEILTAKDESPLSPGGFAIASEFDAIFCDNIRIERRR